MSIQVSWTISDPDTRKREIDALLEVSKSFHTQKNLIITLDETELIEIDGIRIEVLTADDFLLKIEKQN